MSCNLYTEVTPPELMDPIVDIINATLFVNVSWVESYLH